MQGQLEYMERAISWSAAAGLKVWIDLHGAPGSQNGFDNSGFRDGLGWQSIPGNVEHTKKVIHELVRQFASHPAVTGIELLNERKL